MDKEKTIKQIHKEFNEWTEQIQNELSEFGLKPEENEIVRKD